MNYQRGQLIDKATAQTLALQVAEGGQGFVSPNPLVGCVVVDKNHAFLSSGFHQKWGGPHAEVDAFKNLQAKDLEGATVYVTLEPCAHHGKTPPCAELLAKYKLAKVVIGALDPNPLVAGKGVQYLREHKIEVEVSQDWNEACLRLAEIFHHHILQKSPFVALKAATSLDGQIALKSGESQWITNEKSRLRSRELRARYDAVVIGANTLLQDNPLLDYRGTAWEGVKKPQVVIYDPRGNAKEFLPRSHLGKSVDPERIHFLSEINTEALCKLYAQGICSLFVEGGAKTHGLFLQQKLLQKIYLFMGPHLLGQGRSWTEGFQISSLQEKISLRVDSITQIESDFLFTARLHENAP